MKKLFTMIFALCISLGAWAEAVLTDDGGNNYTVASDNVGSVAAAASTINAGFADWRCRLIITGPINDTDVSTINNTIDLGNSLGENPLLIIDYCGADLSAVTSLSLADRYSGIGLPASYDLIASAYNADFAYQMNGSTVNLNVAEGGLTKAISVMQNKLYLLQYQTINLSGTYTDAELTSLRSVSGVTVNEVVVVKSYTAQGGQVESDLNGEDLSDITALKVTGTLTSADITWISTNLTNLTKLDLTEATLAEGASLNSLSTLKVLKVSSTIDDSNVSIAGLDYIYTVGVSKVKIVTAGSMAAAIADNSDDAATATSVTVTGTLNNDDLATLSGFEAVTLLNLSDITVASGSSITNLDAKGTAAIVLPNSITNAELGTLQHVGGDNPTYKCLAYLEDAAYQSSGNDHKVCVYTTQCSSLLNLSSFVNTNSSLVFQPLYKTDGSLENYMLQYNNEIQNLLTYAKELPVLNIDFTFVYVGMSTDFSVLNPATHYITIPVNGTDYDFTDEVNPYNAQTGEKYTYSDYIWVVATYKNPDPNSIYAKSCSYAGKSFTATEPTTITYVRNAGKLSGASGAVNEEMLTSTRMIFVGNLNASDVSAMAMMRATTFDFIDATITVNDMKSFSNPNVKYLALPYNANDAIAATSPNTCNFSTTCPALLCVGALNPTSKTFTAWAKQNLDENGVQIPSLYVVTGLINKNTSIENLTLSGYYCRRDVKVLSSVSDNSGLIGATIKTADLTNAVFAPNSEMVLSMAHNDASHPGASWGSLTSILLPTSSAMTDIPDYCLNNAQGITSICIPYNIQNIGAFSFALSYINTVTTTDAAGEEIGYGNKTLTFSSNLKSIKEGAFQTQDETISDVYVLATTAPKCEANAFSAGGLYGWGGFGGNNTHPMCRKVYWNGDAHQFTMLHFPSDVTLDEAKKYTDVTRDYTLWDETGDYNGIGELRVWPNFSEIYRAYNQAVDGVTWDAWDLTRSKANPNDIPCWPTSYKDANGATVTVPDTYYAGVLIPASTTPATSAEANGYVYDTDYMGWHQFVLADYHRYKEIVIETADSYEDGEWYTLCIPFDMTEDEVIRVMGVPASTTTATHSYTGGGHQISETSTSSNKGAYLPTVYSLKTVTRQNPKVTLGFSQELMNQIVEKGKNLVFNADGTIRLGDDTYSNANKEGKILIRGGYPYLVRPIFPSDFNEASNVKGNLGRYILSVSEFSANDRGKDAIFGEGSTTVTMPIITQKVKAIDANGAVVTYSENVYEKDAEGNNTSVLIGKKGDPYYYFFQGTFTKQMLPQSYILTNSVTGPDNLWHRVTKAGTREWDSYTAIVGSNTTVNGAAYYTASGTTAETGDDFSTWYVRMNSHKDDFIHSGSNDVKYEITFENEEGFDEVVAIDKIDGKDLNNSVLNSPVYNMAGQRIANSMEGLNKGLYIVNGKKVLVK